MLTTMNDILHPGAVSHHPDFPYAPPGWSRDETEVLAKRMGIEMTEDHWEVVRVLQGCYTDEKAPRIRLLCAAMEARFKKAGGIQYVYDLFPDGPVGQGCKLAGVKPPAGATDSGEGSA